MVRLKKGDREREREREREVTGPVGVLTTDPTKIGGKLRGKKVTHRNTAAAPPTHKHRYTLSRSSDSFFYTTG